MLNSGPTIWILAGARRLNQSLNSVKEKEMLPASPEKLTELTLPEEKSAETEPSLIELKGLCPRERSSCLTLSGPQLSVPAGGLSG